MVTRPLVICVLSFAAGILSAAQLLPFSGSFLVPILCASAAALVFVGLTRLRAASCVLLFLLLGMLYGMPAAEPGRSEDHVVRLCDRGGLFPVLARIVDDPRHQEDRVIFTIEAEGRLKGGRWVPCRGKVRTTILRPQHNYCSGQWFVLPLKPGRPRNYQNPGAFDYVSYLARRGVYATAFLKNDANVVPVIPQSRSFMDKVQAFRSRLAEFFESRLAPLESSVLKAMVLGNRGYVGAEVREAFQRTGTGHLLAVSGLHMGMVALTSFFVINRLLRRSPWLLARINVSKAALTAVIVPLGGYALVAGGSVSALRAFFMVVCFLAAWLLDRDGDPLSALALAGLVTLAGRPQAIQEVSFQFSYVAVTALICMGGLGRTGPGAGKVAGYARGLVVVSAVAWLATTPIGARHFNQISLLSVPANCLLVPVVGLWVLPLGLLSALLHPLQSSLSGWVLDIAAFPLYWAADAVRTIARWPWCTVKVFTPRWIEIAGFLTVLLLALNFRRWKGAKWAIAGVLVLGLADTAYWVYRSMSPQEFSITFLDVGQGNSAVVTFPGGSVMVVDGGGTWSESFDMGERVVAPYLWWNRIMHVDTLVLTHAERDHMEGLVYLAEHFGVRELWTSGREGDSEVWRRLMEVVGRKGIRHRVMSAEMPTVVTGGVSTRVLHPGRATVGDEGMSWNSNNYSLVLQMSMDGLGVLLPGDIEALGEEALVVSGTSLSSDVILAPHHGSGTSSTNLFLDAVNPGVVVFSAGSRNPWGFPAADVVRRYSERGCAVYRTDRDGAVSLVANEGGVAVRTYVGRNSGGEP